MQVLPQSFSSRLSDFECYLGYMLNPSESELIREGVEADSLSPSQVAVLVDKFSDEFLANIVLVKEQYEYEISKAKIAINASIQGIGAIITRLTTSIALFILISWAKNTIPTPFYFVAALITSLAIAFFSVLVFQATNQYYKEIKGHSIQLNLRNDLFNRLICIIAKCEFIIDKTTDWSSLRDPRGNYDESDNNNKTHSKLSRGLERMKERLFLQMRIPERF